MKRTVTVKFTAEDARAHAALQALLERIRARRRRRIALAILAALALALAVAAVARGAA